MKWSERRKYLTKEGRCSLCTEKHTEAICPSPPKCEVCNRKHSTSMHDHSRSSNTNNNVPKEKNTNAPPSRSSADYSSGNNRPSTSSSEVASTLCTKFCDINDVEIDCSKIFLVDIFVPSIPDKSIRCYAILDDHSNLSYVDPAVVDYFDLDCPTVDYYLGTLTSLRTKTEGTIVSELEIQGVGENSRYRIKNLIANPNIPNSKQEVASPDLVRSLPHIAHLADNFNPIDDNAEVLILLGRRCSDLIKMECHGDKAPYAFKNALGWACVGTGEESSETPTLSSNVLKAQASMERISGELSFASKCNYGVLPDIPDVFIENSDDELPGLSKNDERFLNIVSQKMDRNSDGSIVMPLPFKTDHVNLPNNMNAVYNRTRNTLSRLHRDPDKLAKCIEAMGKNISAGHVEKVPPGKLEPPPGKSWFIPVFPVLNPKKSKIRLVFDSSAQYHGTSLNSELLQGPDLTNHLRTILMRFRKHEIGFTADVEAMFYAFKLHECDMDYTRFFWFDENEPTNGLVQYRATVHIFGNTSSPCLANIGLRKAASDCTSDKIDKVVEFVHDNFYVDDALGSAETEDEALSILNDTISTLKQSNIRLHKINSNSNVILRAFPSEERKESTTIGEPRQDLCQRTFRRRLEHLH